MNFELSSSNLPEIAQIVTTLIAEGKCSCHIINPHKTRILLWKQTKPDEPVIYHLRIGIQKFTSQTQTDRNGEVYWRMYSAEVKPEAVNKEPTKFNQRQEDAKSDHPEQSVNSSTS